MSSFVKFGGQISMTFKQFALKWPCVSWHVSLSFTCSFRMKFMWEVLNLYTNLFGFETSRWKSPRKNQGSLKKDPSLVSKLLKTSQSYRGNRRPIGEGRRLTLRPGRDASKKQTYSKTTDQQNGPLVGWLSVDWSIGRGLPSCTVHCNVRRQVVSSPTSK